VCGSRKLYRIGVLKTRALKKFGDKFGDKRDESTFKRIVARVAGRTLCFYSSARGACFFFSNN
jgi:hypothetical protein